MTKKLSLKKKHVMDLDLDRTNGGAPKGSGVSWQRDSKGHHVLWAWGQKNQKNRVVWNKNAKSFVW